MTKSEQLFVRHRRHRNESRLRLCNFTLNPLTLFSFLFLFLFNLIQLIKSFKTTPKHLTTTLLEKPFLLVETVETSGSGGDGINGGLLFILKTFFLKFKGHPITDGNALYVAL